VPVTIEIRIFNRTMIKNVPVEDGVTGFVWSFETNTAAVLYDRVQNLVATNATDVASILGIAMAHEIGHLLLRSPKHSLEGIMQQNWLPKDLLLAAQGRLHFTAEESQRMRDEVFRRSPRPSMVQNQCRFTPEQARMLDDRYGTPTAASDDPDLHLHNLTPTLSGALDGAQNVARVFAPTALQEVPGPAVIYPVTVPAHAKRDGAAHSGSAGRTDSGNRPVD